MFDGVSLGVVVVLVAAKGEAAKGLQCFPVMLCIFGVPMRSEANEGVFQ